MGKLTLDEEDFEALGYGNHYDEMVERIHLKRLAKKEAQELLSAEPLVKYKKTISDARWAAENKARKAESRRTNYYKEQGREVPLTKQVRLTDTQAADIIACIVGGTHTYIQIMAHYGISRQTAYNIVSGKTFKHLKRGK